MNDMLFDVPKNPPKIEAFKAKYQIETLASPGCDPLWCALHLPTAWECAYVDKGDNLCECMAKACRILDDELGLVGYGDTEADAIIETCKACGITVLPSDL